MRMHRGLTLVDVTVGLAAGVVFVGAAVAEFGGGRAGQWAVRSGAMQQVLFQGVIAFSAENDGFIPGTNSSGKAIADFQADVAALYEISTTDPTYPTNNFDWATPALVGFDLPADREERMSAIWSHFFDPALTQDATEVYGRPDEPGVQEALDFEAENGPWVPNSFFMPSVWQYYDATEFDFSDPRNISYKQIGAPFTGDDSPATLPKGFTPRLESFGDLAKKIAIADGFRYHAGEIIDFDARLETKFYGPWTTSGAIYNGSTSYGTGKLYDPDEPANPSNGMQVPLSYRHGLRLDATRWDGSWGMYTIEASHDPTLWYPSGSTFNGTTAVQNAFDHYRPGDTID